MDSQFIEKAISESSDLLPVWVLLNLCDHTITLPNNKLLLEVERSRPGSSLFVADEGALAKGGTGSPEGLPEALWALIALNGVDWGANTPLAKPPMEEWRR